MGVFEGRGPLAESLHGEPKVPHGKGIWEYGILPAPCKGFWESRSRQRFPGGVSPSIPWVSCLPTGGHKGEVGRRVLRGVGCWGWTLGKLGLASAGGTLLEDDEGRRSGV